jgi:hypothetical protein
MSHQKFQSCIDACYECATACKHCANACLDEKDIKMLVQCIKLDNDCAAICVLSAKMMANGSQFLNKICALCAEVCEACAKECGKHSDLDHCKKCAEACRKCTEECRAMSEIHVK